MSDCLLAGILGLDWRDFLLHLLNFVILVCHRRPVVSQAGDPLRARRRDEDLRAGKTHDEKMKEAEETNRNIPRSSAPPNRRSPPKERRRTKKPQNGRKRRSPKRKSARKSCSPRPRKKPGRKKSRPSPPSGARWPKWPCSSPRASSTRRSPPRKTPASSTTA